MSSNADRPKQPRDFDPVSFAVVPPRKFEDLRVGDVFRVPSRTLTDAHAAAFQTVSADIILSTMMWSMHGGTGTLRP